MCELQYPSYYVLSRLTTISSAMSDKDQVIKALRSNSKPPAKEMSVAELAEVMKAEMKTQFVSFQRNTKEEIQKLGDTLTERMDKMKSDLAADIDSLRDENKETLQRFASTMDNIKADTAHALDAGRRLNDLIASGVPFVRGEDLNAYFHEWCRSLGYSENNYPLADVRRLANKISNGAAPIILIQFAITVQRNDFYSAYLRSRALSTQQIGFSVNKRIYINENLGIAARAIRAKALKMKKEGKLRSVFTRTGIVYIKRLNDDREIAVKDEAELDG